MIYFSQVLSARMLFKYKCQNIQEEKQVASKAFGHCQDSLGRCGVVSVM